MIYIWNSSKTDSFPYLLSYLDNFINVNALKTSTPQTSQDALFLYLHIETSQERSGHTVMITDQQRLRLIIKTSHASGRGLACNRKQKKTKKRAETQLTRTEKLIGPIWRARREDQSYGLGSSIRRPERQNL